VTGGGEALGQLLRRRGDGHQLSGHARGLGVEALGVGGVDGVVRTGRQVGIRRRGRHVIKGYVLRSDTPAERRLCRPDRSPSAVPVPDPAE